MGRLNRYLFKEAIIKIGGLIVFAIVVLLLERLLRIFEIVSNSTNPAGDAGSMVINLLPYYLGMAVPMALLLGITMTIDSFSRTSEYLQPVGRYNYRQVVHVVKQQSFTAALREGTFTSVGNRTFFAGTEKEGSAIGPIFIYEKLMKDGAEEGVRVTTADEGRLIVREATNEPVLQLASGQTYQILGERQLSGDLSFESSAVAGAVNENMFRSRGDDEREMTTRELWNNRDGTLFNTIDTNTNNAALHLRLARSALLLILPFIAVPFGINYGRNPSSAGIFIGIVMLVSLQKALEFGQSLGANGVIAPWLGIWPIIGLVAVFAAYIFRKSAFKMGQPPLTAVSFYMKEAQASFMSRLRKVTRFGRANEAS